MHKLEQTKLIKRSIFWLTVLIMVVGSTFFYEKGVFQNNFEALPVSSSTKQLPIYCVDTEKKQVALSFDAAWGNEDTQTHEPAQYRRHHHRIKYCGRKG